MTSNDYAFCKDILGPRDSNWEGTCIGLHLILSRTADKVRGKVVTFSFIYSNPVI
jgi:hypothetical protein